MCDMHAATREEKRREMGTAREEETLVEAALRVLNTADPFEKAKLGDIVASRWLNAAISRPYHPSLHLPVPDRPARLSNVIFSFLFFFFEKSLCFWFSKVLV